MWTGFSWLRTRRHDNEQLLASQERLYSMNFVSYRSNTTNNLSTNEQTNYMELNPTWKANSHLANQEIPPLFLETEGSLPCSQGPATGPYPEQVGSGPQLLILFP
jgi:hypothetical protein